MENTRKRKQTDWKLWLPLIPTFIFSFGFQIIPVFNLVRSSFYAEKTGVTLDYFKQVFTSSLIMDAFKNTMILSFLTAFIAVILGFLVAFSIVSTKNKFVRSALTALSDVTTNFGGAPLAFAFIVILGSTGVVTLLLKEIGINLYPNFRIYSLQGLLISYLYFQIPLMILNIIPSIQGLKTEWWEGALNLGANTMQYWLRIALPILLPSLISSFLLLFSNSFGAYATAYTLTGSDVNLVMIQIGSLIRGEVQVEPELANAIAAICLLIMGLCVSGYVWFGSRSRK